MKIKVNLNNDFCCEKNDNLANYIGYLDTNDNYRYEKIYKCTEELVKELKDNNIDIKVEYTHDHYTKGHKQYKVILLHGKLKYEMKDNFESNYPKKQYDPKWYKARILNTIEEARRNGIRVDYYCDKLMFENTTSREEEAIYLDNEFN